MVEKILIDNREGRISNKTIQGTLQLRALNYLKNKKVLDEEIYKYARKYLEENLHIGRSRIIYINLNWLKI